MGTIKVGKEEVDLNEEILNVDIDTVNNFLSKYAGLYRYYANKHNDAAFIYKRYLDQYNSTLNSKFKEYKLGGVNGSSASDKLAESASKCDPDVLALQEKMRAAEYVKDELYSYLRSMDYAHENAMQVCYNARKEMNMIDKKTVMGGDSHTNEATHLNAQLSKIFGK